MSKHEKSPVFEQGEQAAEAGLTSADCPYGEGENRDEWLKGLVAGKSSEPGGEVDAAALA